MLGGDAAFSETEVTALATDTGTDASSGIMNGTSLMYFFYAPDGRQSRLSALSSQWSYVVLLEQEDFSLKYPEYYFEGVRVFACAARASGAKPIVLMSWTGSADDIALRGAVTYRVANGAGAIVASAGYARQLVQLDASISEPNEQFLAAASVYSTMTGRNAADSKYQPSAIGSQAVSQLGEAALSSQKQEATKWHYQSPYKGLVQIESMKSGGEFWFLDWGTSSEALWHNQMNTILPKAGFSPKGTAVVASNTTKTCDDSCLTAATGNLQTQQYDLFYARDYSVSADTIRALGPQADLQVQVWDRHADNIAADGLEAIGMMEYILTNEYDRAKPLGLVITPYHLMFSKLKTLRPSVNLTSDGTHATGPVSYGQATMSVVARTGITPLTTGLDEETRVAAQLGAETIRQLSSLSATGMFVSDDPENRPK
jgi:hypothetical protein